ncbi:hypothetical protein [Marinobacter salarius]|uniref:hypothetical protein n=1 Tax=Marinobacter salarius TaxID=1420917 RepID=UPI003D0FEDEC
MRDIQQKRLENVNQFIREIGSHGRQFFYNSKHDRYARMEMDDRGRVWFVDDYSEKRIYTHLRNRNWRGFSHGGTLRSLVELFCDHIKKGTQLRYGYFSVNPNLYCSGHPWGYGHEDYPKLREAGIQLGIISSPANAKQGGKDA